MTTLSPALLGLLMLSPFCLASESLSFEGKLLSNSTSIHEFKLAQADYVHGYFSSKPAAIKLELLDHNNQLLSDLLTPGQSDGRILFIAETSGLYRIKISSAEQQTSYQIKLEPP